MQLIVLLLVFAAIAAFYKFYALPIIGGEKVAMQSTELVYIPNEAPFEEPQQATQIKPVVKGLPKMAPKQIASATGKLQILPLPQLIPNEGTTSVELYERTIKRKTFQRIVVDVDDPEAADKILSCGMIVQARGYACCFQVMHLDFKKQKAILLKLPSTADNETIDSILAQACP
jgi:hypothetical protein